MKTVFTSLLLMFYLNIAFAQLTNIDWIKKDQKYLKIEVNKTGVYAIKVSDVVKYLPEILSSKTRSIEIYNNGRSINFSIISKGDLLTEKDSIIFYGEKNDGRAESEFYRPNNAQPNTFFSLFTDISAYYLTINPKQNIQKSISLEGNQNAIATISSQNFTKAINYSSDFTFNSVTGPIPYIQQSYFESGETYTGTIFKENLKYELPIDLNNLKGSYIDFEIQLNGRDNSFNRKVTISFGGVDTTLSFYEFSSHTVKFRRKVMNQNANPSILFVGSGGTYSINYLKYTYEKEVNLDGSEGYLYFEQNLKSKFELKNLSNLKCKIWNVTDPYNVSEAFTNDYRAYNIEPKNSVNTYFYFSEYRNALKVSLFEPSNYSFNNKANYLIVTSKKLAISSTEYANYRSSVNGGEFIVETVFVEDLYDLFNFGIKNPLAIKNYLRYKLKTGSPTYLLLLGKAFSTYTGRNSELNLVPTFGYPASDVLLSSGITTDIDVPGLATGRIPAQSDDEVYIYIDKLKQKLNFEPEIQQKNVIHLSGGESFAQINSWASHMAELAEISQSSNFGTNILSKKKQILDPKEPANIASNLNDGLSLISFLGHSAYQIVDLNIDFVSNPLIGYDNKRYPVLYFNGCAFNNYFREIKTLSQDWIFTPNKGAIATIGQSYFGYPTSLINHAKLFYETIFNAKNEPTIGEALKQTAEKIVNISNKNDLDILHVHQTLIFGDPALKIFGFNKPDLKIDKVNLSDKDSTKLFLKWSNLGRVQSSEHLTIRVIQKNSFQKDTLYFSVPFTRISDSLIVPLRTSSFISEIEIKIDPKNNFDEENESNNDLIFKFNEKQIVGDNIKPSVLVLFENQNPYNNMISSLSPKLSLNIIDDNNLPKSNFVTDYLTIYLKSCDTCQYQILPINNYEFSLVNVTDKNINLQLSLKNLEPGFYEMAIIVKDKAGNSTKENPYLLNFEVSIITGIITEYPKELKVYPNPSSNCIYFDLNNLNVETISNIFLYIYSIDGKLIDSWESKNPIEIWCKNSPGVYLYKVTQNENNIIRLIKTGKIQIMN